MNSPAALPLIRAPPRAPHPKITRAHGLIDKALERLARDLENGKSQTLKEYLSTMAKFTRYSLRNVFLIGSQKPEASHVAGFQTWKSLGRNVRKGEKGILILAPIVRNRKSTESDSEEEVLFGFRPAHVFDISQTEGKPLPEFARVRGDPGGLLPSLVAAIRKRGIAIESTPDLGRADGASSGGKILIRPGLPSAEEFSVLVHEFAHEILHQKPGEKNQPKTVKETEAEAVAFVVCSVIGLDTSTSSSDYIQIYQGDKETLYRSLEAIRDTASEIFAGLLGSDQALTKKSCSSVPGLEAGSDREESKQIETYRRYENMKGETKSIENQMQDLEIRLAELAAEAGRLQESLFVRRGEPDPEDHRKYLYMRIGEIEAEIRKLWRETVRLNAEGYPEVRA